MKKKSSLGQRISAFFADSSPFMTLVGRIALLVVLNVCFLVCALPVVTAGASAAALYGVLRERRSHTFDTAFIGFFRLFFRHFVTATALWLPFLALLALLAADLHLLAAGNLLNNALALTPLLLASGLCGITLVWVFPILAVTGGRALPTLRAAFFTGLRELWRSLALLALTGLPAVLLFFAPQIFMALWGFGLLLGIALLAAVKLALMNPVLQPPLP